MEAAMITEQNMTMSVMSNHPVASRHPSIEGNLRRTRLDKPLRGNEFDMKGLNKLQSLLRVVIPLYGGVARSDGVVK